MRDKLKTNTIRDLGSSLILAGIIFGFGFARKKYVEDCDIPLFTWLIVYGATEILDALRHSYVLYLIASTANPVKAK